MPELTHNFYFVATDRSGRTGVMSVNGTGANPDRAERLAREQLEASGFKVDGKAETTRQAAADRAKSGPAADAPTWHPEAPIPVIPLPGDPPPTAKMPAPPGTVTSAAVGAGQPAAAGTPAK